MVARAIRADVVDGLELFDGGVEQGVHGANVTGASRRDDAWVLATSLMPRSMPPVAARTELGLCRRVSMPTGGQRPSRLMLGPEMAPGECGFGGSQRIQEIGWNGVL
jgi:hypothetical protein